MLGLSEGRNPECFRYARKYHSHDSYGSGDSNPTEVREWGPGPGLRGKKAHHALLEDHDDLPVVLVRP